MCLEKVFLWSLASIYLAKLIVAKYWLRFLTSMYLVRFITAQYWLRFLASVYLERYFKVSRQYVSRKLISTMYLATVPHQYVSGKVCNW